MQAKTIRNIVIVVAILISGIFSLSPVNVHAQKSVVGTEAYKHTEFLSEKIGSRVAGSVNEEKAGDYIFKELEKLGYQPTKQKFSYTRNKITINSANIIGTKYSHSNKYKSDPQIIIGAHYDSVSVGKGADDNASSIGVILETAKAIQKRNLHYDIKFVFFGAEEQGLRGSNYYVSQMSQEEKDRTIAMINLDSLLAGDKIYVYGSPGEDGWIRDLSLEIAKKNNIPLETNPGINPEYPKGTTGDWSDHAPFKKAGIPIAYFEATNWEIGDLDGYTQTVKHGAIWHTKNDNLAFLEKEFPGRVETHFAHFTEILTQLLYDIKKVK
ncbi:M20/M25/M40 family metallo-hydrolase [Neobacillus sp. WH10]|uniref:M20/M25/M40 family metallo-hydrolase n=1 Tax=Neobacillus sp. WH10 TaxID=3047873 RepID=UPI0024C0F18C|nr:M20/M25/M40 family metallo-hydrolase [Neobacillus sp. WH10]WHY79790.1 M20/M25/M40 family metallo-hydrolase [Neobacillus sp. WH10]